MWATRLLFAAVFECWLVGCTGIAADLSSLAVVVADAGSEDVGDAGSIVQADAGQHDAGGLTATDAGTVIDAGALAACVDTAPQTKAAGPQWVNATGNLAGMTSDCANLSRAAAVPCSPSVIVSVASVGLWASEDRGVSWHLLGRGAGSAPITNRATSIIFDPADPTTFWETGLYGGGLYKTSNAGASFSLLGAQTSTQWVSVDFADPDRKTLLTGTHGMKQLALLSQDRGTSWTNVGANLPDDSDNSEFPLILDSTTFLLGGSSGSASCGIFRTTDAGQTWQRVSSLSVSHFGAPLHASDGSIYWPLHSDAGLAKSIDGGRSWVVIVKEGVMAGVTPLELPDHSIVIAGVDHLLRSTDRGSTWSPIVDPLPFSLTGGNQGGVTYSAHLKSFFLWHWDCGSTVLSDAVMTAGYDPEAS